LVEARRLLSAGGVSPEVIPRLSRHLRAAGELATLAAPFSPGSHRQDMLIEAWTALADGLLAAKVTDGSQQRAVLVEAVGLALVGAAPDGDAGQSRLRSALTAGGGRPDGAPAPTVQTVFAEEVDRVLSAFAALEPDYGGRLLEHQLATSWRAIACLRSFLSERLRTLRAAMPPFLERVARAASIDDFAALLGAHRGDLPHFMALCYCLAARSATSLDEQQSLAQAMERHRATGLQLSPAVGIGAPACSGTIIGHLADPRTEETVRVALREIQPEADGDERVYLGTFDRISAEVRHVVELHIR
jgi:hypothetical protein